MASRLEAAHRERQDLYDHIATLRAVNAQAGRELTQWRTGELRVRDDDCECPGLQIGSEQCPVHPLDEATGEVFTMKQLWPKFLLQREQITWLQDQTKLLADALAAREPARSDDKSLQSAPARGMRKVSGTYELEDIKLLCRCQGVTAVPGGAKDITCNRCGARWEFDILANRFEMVELAHEPTPSAHEDANAEPPPSAPVSTTPDTQALHAAIEQVYRAADVVLYATDHFTERHRLLRRAIDAASALLPEAQRKALG